MGVRPIWAHHTDLASLNGMVPADAASNLRIVIG
jgi:hypothetical protein